MKKIRIITILFDGKLKSSEIPAFRAAVIEKAGRQHSLFHNHKDNDSFHYRYPLIQYKTISGKAAIQCVNEGVDEIHHFFEKKDWNLLINGNTFQTSVEDLKLTTFTFQVWDKEFTYNIKNWVALNQKNYTQYIQMESLSDKITFLEKLLTSNILSMAKGIGWQVDNQIKLTIVELSKSTTVKIKDQPIIAFNIIFKCNVGLPHYIGLGKSVSIGYGVVKQHY